jgi:ATP-dependent 26S proteasome regulatory subunit
MASKKDIDKYTAPCWRDLHNLLAVIPGDLERILLYGLPGPGKSYFGKVLADYLERHFYVSPFYQDMSPADLIGCYLPDGEGGAKWHDGPAIRAWREPAVCVFDEIDEVGGDVYPSTHTILDDKETARLTLPTGETLAPMTCAPRCVIGFRCE